jgi:hypothetical protein
MADKALTVLAACIDARSGKRLTAGDEFSPPPTRDQAERLVKAGCLPIEAIDVASDDIDRADPTASTVRSDAVDMRTDEGEGEAREADADARDRQAEAIAVDKRSAPGRAKASK